MWPQETDLLFPNYVAAKQTSLFLHKIRGRNQRTYSSSIKWTQNKRAYCYTNNMAATSGLFVTHIMWPQETDLLFHNYVALKQAGLLLHKLCGRNTQTFSNSNT